MDSRGLVLGNACHILRRFLIVAMPMVHPFVGEIILPAQGGRDAVIDFQDVLGAYVETTAWALSFLQSQEFCFLAAHQGMLFEPLCPVDQVSIVGTRLSSDFHVVLVQRVRVLSDGEGRGVPCFVFHVRPKSETVVHLDSVPVPQPVFALPRMSRSLPAGQLLKGDVLTGAKHVRANPSFVVVGPPADDRVERPDHGCLRSGSQLSQEPLNFLGIAFPGRLTGGDNGLEPEWLSLCVFTRVCLAHTILSLPRLSRARANWWACAGLITLTAKPTCVNVVARLIQ